MPILDDLTQFGVPARVSGSFDAPEPKPAPGGLEVLGAAFRRENEVGAGLTALMNSQSFEPDPAYNPFSDDELKATTLIDRYGDRFIGVRSQGEARALRSKIEREEADRKLLDSAGGWGMVAEMAAGVLSPTSLLPGGAVLRAGRIGVRAARSGASVAGAAAAGTAVQETALQTIQESRTMAESAMNVAGSVVLGGLLGAGIGALPVGRAARIAQELEGSIEPETHMAPLMGGRGQSVGAAAAPSADLTLKQGFGGATIAKLTAFMTPLQRMQTSDAAASREAVYRLADPGGVRVMGNTEAGGFEPTMPGGSVETRARMQVDSLQGSFFEQMDRTYAEYWKAATGGEGFSGKIGMALNAGKKALAVSDGPMSPSEFSRAVGIAIRTDNAESGDAFVKKAAALFSDHIKQVHELAQRAGVAEPIEGGPKFAGGYVPRIFNAKAIAARAVDFENIVLRNMKADQDRKSLLKGEIERATAEMTATERAARKLESRAETSRKRLDNVQARIDEVAMSARRGQSRLETADMRVSEMEQEIADLEAALVEARGTRGARKSDLDGMEKELSTLRRARDKALRDSAKMPESPPMERTVPRSAREFVDWVVGNKGKPREPSFLQWVIRQGGVKDTGGDIRSAFGGKPPRGLVRPDADDLDKVAQRYGEQVGRGDEDFSDRILDYITAAERGENPPEFRDTYPMELQQRIADYEAAQEVARAMREAGMDNTDPGSVVAFLRDEDPNTLPGKPAGPNDMADLEDIYIDPVQEFRAADERVAGVQAEVKRSEQIIKALRGKLQAKARTEARGLGRQGEAAVNARASRSRVEILLDRAERIAAQDKSIADELAALSRQKEVTRGKIEKVISDWEGDTSKKARAAIERRTKMEADRAKEGKTGRLSTADAEVDLAAKRILRSERAKSDAELRAQARDVVQNMIATPEGRLPYEWGETASKESRAMSSSGAPADQKSQFLKERKFPVQDADMLDVLENDVRTVFHAYAHSMIPQAEMARAFDGDVTGSSAIRAIQEEYNAKAQEAKTEKERLKLQGQMNADIKDFTAMRDRVLGTYALPVDPDSLFYRGATVAKQLNFMSKLGGMVVSQLPDIGNIVLRNGLGNTFDALAAGLARFSSSPDAQRISRKERQILADSGIGLELVNGSRALSFSEIATDYGRGSKFERGVRSASAAFSVINLSRHWDTAAQTMAGVASLRRLMRGVEEWATTGASKDAEWLASHNIGANQARRIWAAAEAGEAERVKGVLMPEGRTWRDQEAYEIMRVALRQSVDDTIIKPGQDKPLWMSTTTGGVIGQFRSFFIAAQQRILIAGLQQADANMVQGVVSMFGLGLMAVAISDLIREGKLKERAPGEWAVEGFDRSGLSGWLMETNNMAEKISGQQFGLRPMAGAEPASRYLSRSAADVLLGPTLGFASDVTRIAGAGLRGEVERGDIRALRNQIPGQNLIWMRWGFNRLQEGAEQALGIEPLPPK
jgi:hypothetical protein